MGIRKNAAAVELANRRMVAMTKEQRQEVARSGGLVGGAARAEKLTPEERSASAKKAALARWGPKKAVKKAPLKKAVKAKNHDASAAQRLKSSAEA
jgi:hypothetical protein